MNEDRFKSTVAKIQAAYPGFTPKVGLVLGSGLGSVADAIKEAKTFATMIYLGFQKVM